jgi:hypothetical protein
MKKIIMLIFCGLFIPSSFSQNGGHGNFVKRVEENYYFQPNRYNNLKSKGDIEKLFFGDFNALSEFSYLPSSDNAFRRPPSGFRVLKNSSNTSYILEVKYISNYEETSREASKKYPTISNDNRAQIVEHNRVAFAKRHEEMLNLFKVETRSFTISNQFAEKLYEKMVSVIDNFKAKAPPTMLPGGYSVVFRNVVDHEVWSLSIHMPQGDTFKMADFCLQIIKDAQSNQMDEKKYISVLNTF